jgi:hypothetical protein
VPIRPATPVAEDAGRPRGKDLPPAADAFWSEDAGALHSAVQAPAGSDADPWAPEGERSVRDGTWRRRLVCLPRPPEALRAIWRPVRLRQLGVAAVAVPLVAAALVGTLWESGGRGTPSGSARHAVTAGTVGRGTQSLGHTSRALYGGLAAGKAATQTPAARRAAHRTTASHRRTTTRRHAGTDSRNAGARRSTVHASRPGAPRHVDSGTTPTSSPTAAAVPKTWTTPPPLTTSAPPTSSANATGGSASSAASTGTAPAFGPTGALGPGSSPNS